MSHKAVRQFIETTAKSLADNVKFGYGRSSDFNKIKDKKYPYIWMDPLNSSFEIGEDAINFTERYSVSLVFYRFDDPDSTEDQYKLILDETDKLVQTFVRKIHENLENAYHLTDIIRTDNTVVENITKQPVIKVMADVLTGWIVTFELIVPDNFDYCP